MGIDQLCARCGRWYLSYCLVPSGFNVDLCDDCNHGRLILASDIRAEQPTETGLVYTRPMLEKAVAEFAQRNPTGAAGTIEGAPYSAVHLSHVVRNLRVTTTGCVEGEVEILQTPGGARLQSLLQTIRAPLRPALRLQGVGSMVAGCLTYFTLDHVDVGVVRRFLPSQVLAPGASNASAFDAYQFPVIKAPHPTLNLNEIVRVAPMARRNADAPWSVVLVSRWRRWWWKFKRWWFSLWHRTSR